MRSFPLRVVAHARHALTHEPREALAYVIERFKRLRKYLGIVERVEPAVFKSDAVVDPSTTLVREIEGRARPAYEAWAAYEPQPYPGAITLVRALRRVFRPGVDDTDPLMGWASLVRGGVDVAQLDCAHVEILNAEHAAALAALLAERLQRL
jgi:thioesterase domain-containing protein